MHLALDDIPGCAGRFPSRELPNIPNTVLQNWREEPGCTGSGHTGQNSPYHICPFASVRQLKIGPKSCTHHASHRYTKSRQEVPSGKLHKGLRFELLSLANTLFVFLKTSSKLNWKKLWTTLEGHGGKQRNWHQMK